MPQTTSPVSLARRATGIGLAFCLAVSSVIAPASAQTRTGGFVRDAETEALIQDYIVPIFKVAGIRSTSVQLYLVANPAFNAFVADGQKIVVNTGAIIDSKVPNELIGVLAHETGHLAGGHQVQLRQQIERAKTLATIGGLLGIGAAVAGAAAGSGDAARAGGGIAAGASEAARRSLLAYQRSEEMAADQSALEYLLKTHQSAKGMITTFTRFADNTLFSQTRINPYLQTHPMPAERIELIQREAKASPYYNTKDSDALKARHNLVRAKLSAFTEETSLVMRRYPPDDVSLPARYARAILAYRTSNSESALSQVAELVKSQPNNPYFWELQGQIMLENGRAGQALPSLRKAVALAPRSGLIKILLGQALVEVGDKKSVDEAVKNLTQGLQIDPDVPIAYRSLARAYALRGDIPMADLATAQGEFSSGDFKAARMHAERAQAALKRGSPGWLRADDILSYNPPKPN
ncbi:M48 family metalloprotease [Kaistia dalseonensis]|uniref:Zn-dependent protease n=1 Tax=Kaistia dalseonensis TaxID=410840 RepID=A0ABU0H2I0_9HYPH|nr:M48 family metalloprotease [Kaistia dalseonensis]MCX5493533.1 M48 family metalloprotease [Kaistia dalseonensis]MDQ0436093.1 putative Zn-dependent protease [Kaistia dalseonensis]